MNLLSIALLMSHNTIIRGMNTISSVVETEKIDTKGLLKEPFRGVSILKVPSSPTSTTHMTCPSSPKIPQDIIQAMQSLEWQEFERVREKSNL